MCCGKPQPVEAGAGEERGIGHALVELAQPRLDVAAERHDLQVGALPQNLRLPSRRRGADDRARGQARRASAYFTLMKASRGSSRSSMARDGRGRRAATPACPSWSARRDRCSPANSASSSSLVNRPLPPASVSGRSVIMSPRRLDDDELAGALARARAPRPAGATTSRACASARGEPRVPMRILRCLQAVLSGC